MTHEPKPNAEATTPEQDRTLPDAWTIPIYRHACDAPVDDDVEDS